jgi:hypothetical protein
MKVHFATAYATGGSINAVDTVDAGSATAVWDEPGVIFLKLLAIAFLVALNGFFVASEFAIVKVRTSQLDALVAQGNRRARPLWHPGHFCKYIAVASKTSEAATCLANHRTVYSGPTG